jgi:hypothetical protein
VSDLDEIKRLLTIAEEFRQAAHSRVDDAAIYRSTGVWEREALESASVAIDKLDQEIEKAQKGSRSGDIDKLMEELGRNALKIIDAFASAAKRILGADDTFIFLPAEARNAETAGSFAAHGAPALAELCRRSLE